MKKIITAFKLLGIALVLLIIDVTTRYTLEQLNIVHIKPPTIPNYYNHPIKDISHSILFIFALMGWLYFLITLLFHFYKIYNRIKINDIFIAISLCFSSFLIYWLLAEQGDKFTKLLEGIIVYLLLGFSLNYLYKKFIPSRK
jgi:hypothetical protein